MKLSIKENNETYTNIYRRFIGHNDQKALEYTVDDAKKQLEGIIYKCNNGIKYLNNIDTSILPENDPDDPFPSTVEDIIYALDLIIRAHDNIYDAVNTFRLW